MIYATRDNEGLRIETNADIQAFETEAEAREWLLSALDPAEFCRDTAIIRPAEGYKDCWIKTTSRPRAKDEHLIIGCFDCNPFTADQLIIEAPGQHPGGQQWWITPSDPVLVVEYCETV